MNNDQSVGDYPKFWSDSDHTPPKYSPRFRVKVSAVIVFLLTLYIIFFYDGERQYYRLYYWVPITIPATLFFLDRISRLREFKAALLIIDLVVLVASFVRVFYPIPFYSGHALFLSFSLLTTQSKLCRLTAILVLLQTIYIKTFLWDNDITLYGGLLMGILLSVIYEYLLEKGDRS